MPPDDVGGMARDRRATEIPLLEHVNNLAYALVLVRAGAADVFNISTVGCGGIAPARTIAAFAADAGIPVLLGNTGELGTAAQ